MNVALPQRALGALLLLVAAACRAVGPDHETPKMALPERWHEQSGPAVESGPSELAQWWRRLNDPLLDSLVSRATAQSLELMEALSRVREARALRGAAKADLYPTVDAALEYERARASERTAFGRIAQLGDTDFHSAGFDASWEVDLWGRVRRSVEAAGAEVDVTIENARDVAVTVAAEVALTYVELRAFQRRVAIAKSNVELQDRTLELARARFESGLVSELDVAQAAANRETTRSRVPALEAGLRAAENRLAVLLGQAPGTLAEELAEARPIPVPPPTVAAGVPADLLRRRADVRRAERVLAAETARVGVAEGDLYPRLSLNGFVGLQAEALKDIGASGSDTFGFGPSVRWNLFDRARVNRQVEAQDARREQARLRWELAVLRALEETENALTAFAREQSRRDALVAATEQALRAAEIARTEYREGLTDFQAVVDSERSLAVLDDELAQSSAAITRSLIAAYKALGGGWDEAGTAVEVAALRE